MDALLCLSVTAFELVAVDKLCMLVTDQHLTRTLSWAVSGFVIQYLALKIYRIFIYPFYYSPLRDIPGPSNNHFLFGQGLNMLRDKSPTDSYVRWMKEHPEAPFIRYLGFFNSENLVPNTMSAHKGLLHTNCYSFAKPTWFAQITKEVGGHGLILMEGSEHRAHRKMLNSTFSVKSIRRLEPVFRQKAKDICGVFEEHITSNDGKTGVFNAIDTFMMAILDVMGTVILGVDLDYVKPGEEAGGDDEKCDEFKKGCTFHKAYDVFFAPSFMGKLLMFSNAFFPFVRSLPCQINREFISAMDWLNEVLLGLIRNRYQVIRAAKKAGTYESDALNLLNFVVEEDCPGGAAEGMGEKEFLGHLLEIMAAGHDTSANMLSFSCAILAEQPDIQDKLREDLMSLPADAPFTDLDRLPYLESFMKESMRIHPPATTYHRAALEDVTIDGVFIPKGTHLDVCPAVTLHNPSIWGEDVDVVDPSRWARLKGDQLNPYAYLPLSQGPRICIGKLFATYEIKILLNELVRNYRFLQVVKPYTVENPSFTLRPAGLEVRMEKI